VPVLLALITAAAAAAPSVPLEARAASVSDEVGVAAAIGPGGADAQPAPDGEDDGFTFLGLLSTRFVVTDVTTDNPLLNGQLVGVLGGLNQTTTSEQAGAYTEHRAGAFFRYAPPVLDGRAALDAAFEIDFGFGDASYGIGGNTGGGYGADQVNLQTRRLSGRYELAEDTVAVVGLQFVADGVHDPGASKLDDLIRSGGKLIFFGSEAAGATVYGMARTAAGAELLRYRVGAYTLLEQGLGDPDDVTLWMADAQVAPAHALRVGAHAWWLRDRAGGQGGAFGSGPTSALSELQGGPRLDYRADGSALAPEVDADLLWLAADVGYNARLDMGDVGATAVAVANLGALYVTEQPDAGTQGYLVDAEARWRFAPGDGSIVRAEALWSRGDGPGKDYYTGVVTGNSYGAVGAVYMTHGCYLLFPDPGAINRQVSAVYDVSGAGEGVVAVTASAGYDLIPSRLTVGVGFGHASTAAMAPVGTEINARVVAKPWVLGNLGAHGAMLLGTGLPQDPWTVLASLDWLVF
jgi:hypothetical protein